MLFLGYDIGGTKCAVCLGESDGGAMHVLDKVKFPTKGMSPYAVLDRFAHEADAMLRARALSFADVAAAGISCGGPLSSARGMILSPPNLPGWDEIPATAYLTEKTGVKTALENDANACAVAEWMFGAGRGTKNMAFFTFGTGLGAGLILDGKLYRGVHDSAGEIGHVRLTPDGPIGFGKAGSCEGWCSGGGIARLAQAEAARRPAEAAALLAAAQTEENITAALVAQLANEGDTFCREIYETSGTRLGQTIAILADILDLERVVIGSIFVRAENLLRPAMERVLREESLFQPEVALAALGESIGDIAALSIAAMM